VSGVREPFLEVLQDSSTAVSLTVSEWTDVIGRARHSSLLPKLSLQIDDDTLGRLAPRVREQLLAARPIAEQHARAVRWEVGRIQVALRGLDSKVVVLKGAAYILGGLPAGVGRLTTDVDILVPRDDLRRVEQALLAAGWAAVKLHPYDQRFYRQWSHELPPLRHSRRRTVVDVHHNILPVSGRLHPDPNKLLTSAVPLVAADVPSGLWMLGPEDMVLHCAVHLFQDGDLAGSVRDLVDADALLRHFTGLKPGDSESGATPGFWDRLPARARELGLERPLFYVLRFAARMLGTPVPASVWAQVARPSGLVVALMDRLVSRSLLPLYGRHATVGEETARTLLYVRSHWLRMPPGQLALHLMKKSMRRWSESDEDT